jgi:hypothetical protein
VRTSLIAIALLASTACHAADVLVMVGESTTWGLRADGSQSPTHAAVVLETLLARRPGCRYANLPVRNWALCSTRTGDWFTHRPNRFCRYAHDPNPVLEYACSHNVPLARALLPAAAARGDRIVGLLVNAQGTNDAHAPRKETPESTVARIAGWRTIMAPIPVWISPPFERRDAPDSTTVRMTKLSPGSLRSFVRRIRQLELEQGLITGPDWGVLMRKPRFQPDGFHLTDGSYAAAAPYWLDVLCP